MPATIVNKLLKQLLNLVSFPPSTQWPSDMALVFDVWLKQKLIIMGNILYVLAVILIIGWLLGAFVFNVGSGLIHILLVIAVIAVLLQVIRGRRV
jgi:hypothetical protein